MGAKSSSNGRGTNSMALASVHIRHDGFRSQTWKLLLLVMMEAVATIHSAAQPATTPNKAFLPMEV